MTEHGTRSRYVHGKCRCDKCRAANTVYHAVANERRSKRVNEIPHGDSGFQNWGCRCDVCSEANRKRCAAWKERVGYRTPARRAAA